MSSKFLNEETDILLYGLRTARQKKRMQHKGFEKKLRRLDKEQTELWLKDRNLGWIDLNPPVMRGWKRYFVLREDIVRSKDSNFFQGILEKINCTQYNHRKDFKIKYRLNGKKQYAVSSQQLKNSPAQNSKEMSFTDKEWQFFEERDVLDWTGKKFYKAYVFTEPWRFVLRVRPNLIFKARIRDEAIESRLAEIDNHIIGNNWRPRIAKLKGNSYGNGWRKEWENEREKYIFKNVPLSQILDAVKEEII